MIFLHNNKLTKDAKVSITSSISRGYGVFETLRTYNNKELTYAKLHLDRLFKSAKEIGLKPKYNKSQILKQLDRVAKKSPHKIQRIKIIATKEDLVITSQKAHINPKIYQGVKCISVKMQRSLPEIKSLSYLPSYLANQKAKKKGAHDAILIDKKGEVYEGAYSNLFWFEGTTLYTRKDKVLPGITRKLVIKNSPYIVKFKTTTLKQLLKSDGVFLTQSINGIVPVKQIDSTTIKLSKSLELIQNFRPEDINSTLV